MIMGSPHGRIRLKREHFVGGILLLLGALVWTFASEDANRLWESLYWGGFLAGTALILIGEFRLKADKDRRRAKWL
jgi:hypothetical protein